MSRLLAIDPGPTQSAFVVMDDGAVVAHGLASNVEILSALPEVKAWLATRLVLEMVASYGMPVGAEVFETCVWIGRYEQAFAPYGAVEKLYRREVKLHLCNSMRATDANVRAAVLDKFGGKRRAVGTKHAKGPLYGVKKDIWQALAVAVTATEKTRV